MKFLKFMFKGIFNTMGWGAVLVEILIKGIIAILFAGFSILIMYGSVDYFKEGKWLYGIGADLFALLILGGVLLFIWSDYDEWKEDRQKQKQKQSNP